MSASPCCATPSTPWCRPRPRTTPSRPRARLFILACLLFLAGRGLAGSAEAACTVTRLAEIPVGSASGLPVVTAMINGQPAAMVLDTGAQRSVLSPEAVARLGVARDEWVATTMGGVGGVERRPNANPRSFTLGGIALVRPTLSKDTSLTVATLARMEPSIDGLLGRDFLAPFDLALDLAGKRLELNRVAGCAGNFLPAPYAALPVANPLDTALLVGVTLDGVQLRALLDSGTQASLVIAPGISRLGLTPEALAGDRSVSLGGIGPRSPRAWLHRFARIEVGRETVAAPLLQVARLRTVPAADMMLGADWMAGRRLWISFATRQVFVAAP